MPSQLYFAAVVIMIFIVIISFPMTIISKYVWRSKTLTQFFAFLGAAALILVIILVWDYIPD